MKRLAERVLIVTAHGMAWVLDRTTQFALWRRR